MGSSSSKGKSYAAAAKYGQIYAKTDKPAYFGGETITGHIYLNIIQLYPGRRLLLKLKGKEIVHIVKSETDTDGNYEENHYKESKDIINILVPIYTWEAVIPGQYTIPFAFILPENLPSTFHQEGHRYMANVSYRLEAILEPDNPKNWNIKLKHKENFIVRRPLTKAAEQKENQIKTEIYTCGCCENGSTCLTVQFAKNYYSPGETAEVLAKLDNTQCKVDNIGLSFTLRQKITLKARGRKFDKEFIKVESRRNGAQIGEVTNTKSLALKLPPFQEGDYRSAKRDHIKLYLLGLGEDNSVMHSATNSKLIFSEYVLKVTCPMDGCCSTTPTAICPIEIYHPEIQAPIVAAPSDWHPKELENVNVSFAPPADYSQQQLMNNNNNIGLGMGSNNMNMLRTDEEIASQYHPPPQFSVDQYAKPQYGENYYG